MAAEFGDVTGDTRPLRLAPPQLRMSGVENDTEVGMGEDGEEGEYEDEEEKEEEGYPAPPAPDALPPPARNTAFLKIRRRADCDRGCVYGPLLAAAPRLPCFPPVLPAPSVLPPVPPPVFGSGRLPWSRGVRWYRYGDLSGSQ